MSMTKKQLEEEEHAKMMMRAITENNVQKIEEALESTKKHGQGFVLTSQFSHKRGNSPKTPKRSTTPHMPMVIGSPIGSPPPSRKSTPSPSRGHRRKKSRDKKVKSAYLTEVKRRSNKVDMAIQSDELDPDRMFPSPPPVTPEMRSESGDKEDPVKRDEELAEMIKEEKDLKIGKEDFVARADVASNGDVKKKEEDEIPPSVIQEEPEMVERKTRKNQRRISSAKFARLGLSKRPAQFKIAPRPQLWQQKMDPANPEPLPSNVYVTRVPKVGGEVKSPFYAQVDIPEGALRGDVIMKFETQDYNYTKLGLKDSDKLCSYIIDVNLTPLTYSLHKEATVKMRILDECINKQEDVVIISSRHFAWQRAPTKIETRQVNGDKHYYAVTTTQVLGKFAVITSQKADRFVMTSAGGLFASTILPDVTIKMEEGAVRKIAHMIEMKPVKVRDEAVTKTSHEARSVEGVSGSLVACSPFIDITKEVMGKSGSLVDGVQIPALVKLAVPITAVVKQPGTNQQADTRMWAEPTIKVMSRCPVTVKGSGQSNETLPGIWTDITAEQNNLVDPVGVQDGDPVVIKARLPGQFMILVFDAAVQHSGSGSSSLELGQVCDLLLQNNRTFDTVVMVHQKVKQPQVISVHVVPEEAAQRICAQMEQNAEWRASDVTFRSDVIRLEERDKVEMKFREGFRPTVNQLPQELQFNSRRWQGYQFELEATEESFSNADTTISGAIEFAVKSNDDDEQVTSHTCYVRMPHDNATPYKPTVIEKPMPKVTVFREYKLKWMKSLSDAEKEKYKAINSP